ncbi:sulfotransferase [Planctobacterium marinum]|uniref:Sulfotransferase domain-containing protein n=1 Tax=Planctobacterium marinum TaxID=1631968 RepID=A0AA48HRJ4_9ALTE|nr:hypothetical protein MACH26_38230 [Planctobacterium marinum]
MNAHNLIHIGLPKTGTTSLQNGWLGNDNVTLSNDGLGSLVEIIRQAIRDDLWYEQIPPIPKPEWDKVVATSQVNIWSSEGLSSWLWNNAAAQEQISKCRWYMADSMAKVVSEATVLIVVRSPQAWCKSIYKQLIQEGGFVSPEEFIQQESGYLSGTLDIRELYEVWAEYFGRENVLIAPFEWIKSDLVKLNSKVCQSMNLCDKTNLFKGVQQANKSITDKEVRFLADLSRQLTQLEIRAEICPASFTKAKQDLLTALRLELQTAHQISNFVDKQVPEINLQLQLNDAMKKHIQQNFIEFLHDYNHEWFGHYHL